MVLVDLRPKGVTAKWRDRLERAGLTCNKNAIPNDPEKPFITSGIRLGSSAGTTRGFGVAEFEKIGMMILRVIDALAVNAEVTPQSRRRARGRGQRLPLFADAFPIYVS